MRKVQKIFICLVVLIGMGLLVEEVKAQGQGLFAPNSFVGPSGANNRVIIGSAGFTEPYSGFNGQGNTIVKINGTPNNVGVPTIDMFKTANNKHGGVISFSNDAYTGGNKRAASIKHEFDTSTKGGQLAVWIRENEVSGMKEALTISRFGYVGINNSTPSNALLHLKEDANSSEATIKLDAPTSTRPNIVFANNGNLKWNIVNDPSNNELSFDTDGSSANVVLRLKQTGQVCIGTSTAPNMTAADGSPYRAFINGGVLANEVKVELGWADHVLEADYCRPSLEEEAAFIAANGHLSGFESAKAMNGYINLGDVTRRQQAKIEEMRLDQIEAHKIMKQQAAEIEDLKAMVMQLLEDKK